MTSCDISMELCIQVIVRESTAEKKKANVTSLATNALNDVGGAVCESKHSTI